MKKIYFIIFSILIITSCSDDDNNQEELKRASVELNSTEEFFEYGEAKEIGIKIVDAENVSISELTGWTTSIDGEVLTITAPSDAESAIEKDGEIVITVSGSDKVDVTAKISVTADFKKTLITFEDEEGSTYWSSLIDSPQYGGPLLYGDYQKVEYSWTDEESGLYSRVNDVYWSGGLAVSNYASLDFEANGSYEQQLTLYGTSGNNGSKNFAVSFGYVDDSGFTSPAWQPKMSFTKGAKTIDYMYIAPTTYFFNVATNGNGLSAPVGTDDVWISATGYLNDEEGVTATTYMIKGGEFLIATWTKWDLKELGKVDKVVFNIGGGTDNGYGFSLPAYFAIDDIMIIHN